MNEIWKLKNGLVLRFSNKARGRFREAGGTDPTKFGWMSRGSSTLTSDPLQYFWHCAPICDKRVISRQDVPHTYVLRQGETTRCFNKCRRASKFTLSVSPSLLQQQQQPASAADIKVSSRNVAKLNRQSLPQRAEARDVRRGCAADRRVQPTGSVTSRWTNTIVDKIPLRCRRDTTNDSRRGRVTKRE